MGFLTELLIVFALATALAGAYQAYRRRGLGKAAHLAVVFGLFIMLLYFLVAVGTDVADFRPEPPAR